MRPSTRLVKFAMPAVVATLLAVAGFAEEASTTGAGGEQTSTATTTATATATSATPAVPPTSLPPPASNVSVIRFAVKDGKVSPSMHEVDVPLGNVVVLEATADVADEIHVHGYDIMVATRPGKAARLEFTADIPGAFVVELEDAKLHLFELRVR